MPRDDATIAAEPGTELSLGIPEELTAEERKAGLEGASPWQLAMRRLRRDKIALAGGFVFLILVFSCIAAPLWANHVAHTTPDENHLSDTIQVDGETVNVVDFSGVPIGPTWQGEFFLGADGNGRDSMVRLLYGGRNSLLIGLIAAIGTTLFGVLAGVLAGFRRGWTDGVISRILDILWAFPVIILGIALGLSLIHI